MRRYIKYILLGFSVITIKIGAAHSTPAVGPTYEIIEKDMLDEIEQTLKEKERTGDLQKLQREAIERAKAGIERPKVELKLPAATRNSTVYYDPSIRVPNTIFDHEGQIVAKEGAVINPLDYVQMTDNLLFIDSDDARQTHVANTLYRHYAGRLKIILIKGAPFEMMRQTGITVYFDQGAYLSRKLRIQSVPSLVSQEGKRLRIDEIGIEK